MEHGAKANKLLHRYVIADNFIKERWIFALEV